MGAHFEYSYIGYSADVGQIFFDCPFCKKERRKEGFSWAVSRCYSITCPFCFNTVVIVNFKYCNQICRNRIDCLASDLKRVYVYE